MPIIVTGVTTGYTATTASYDLPKRLEWQNFIQDIKNLTLYILALKELQKLREDQLVSYFQIAGIHGLPYVQWDGAYGDNPTSGYCHHGMTTFPTWHRPYVALYEQLLASQFTTICNGISDQDRKTAYIDAAAKWRLPYWDWGAIPNIPEEWSTSEIEIQDLDAASSTTTTTKKVSNPLYDYCFKPIRRVATSTEPLVEPSFKGYCPFDHWPHSLRRPRTTKIKEQSHESDANSELQNEIESEIQPWILDLFPEELPEDDPWGQFSNHTWNRINNGTMTSLESIHDHLHDVIGGQGHMGDPAFAGFDPIFFLHHSQVDRLLALWQAVFPSTFVSKGPDMSGTYTHKRDTCQRATDISEGFPLSPFWKSSTTLYNSDDCRDISTLGYTYPEIAEAQGTDISEKVRQKVYELYGGSDGFSETWIVNVQIEKYALGGSGRVAFFLTSKTAGTDRPAIPNDPYHWTGSRHYVGSFSIFATNPGITGCANCKSQASEGMRIGGTVHLTKALSKMLDSKADVGDIVSHLKEHLHWRVFKSNGDEVPVVQVPSLKISVHSRRIVHQVPRWTSHSDVTRGRVGGLDVSF